MVQIYDSTFNYLELIKSESPPPAPPVNYSLKCEYVEQNVYDEPIKDMLPEPEKEATPDYKPVPIKDLINNFEQGKWFLSLILPNVRSFLPSSWHCVFLLILDRKLLT